MALGKYKDARKDFRMVVKHAPGDKDARGKLDECERVIRRTEFEKAIEVDEFKSVTESISIESMMVEPTYDGVHIVDGAITKRFVQDMMERFKRQDKIARKYAFQILIQIKAYFDKQPTLVHVQVPSEGKLTVCGDVHGQYYDLLHLFELAGHPDNNHAFLFNGDFVDRGSFYPDRFYLTRGNHETREMNRMYGFEGEAKHKYNDTLFKLFTECFNALPLAHVINHRIFVVHGGLPSTPGVTLKDISDIHRFKQPGTDNLMSDLLWSDPHPGLGYRPSKRGVAKEFGSDVTDAFLELNGLDKVIRSHEVKANGYVMDHNGKCITVFSAPNYWQVVFGRMMRVVTKWATRAPLSTSTLTSSWTFRRLTPCRIPTFAPCSTQVSLIPLVSNAPCETFTFYSYVSALNKGVSFSASLKSPSSRSSEPNMDTVMHCPVRLYTLPATNAASTSFLIDFCSDMSLRTVMSLNVIGKFLSRVERKRWSFGRGGMRTN
jgi:serine/threonine-protein phosphatase 5